MLLFSHTYTHFSRHFLFMSWSCHARTGNGAKGLPLALSMALDELCSRECVAVVTMQQPDPSHDLRLSPSIHCILAEWSFGLSCSLSPLSPSVAWCLPQSMCGEREGMSGYGCYTSKGENEEPICLSSAAATAAAAVTQRRMA